MIDEKELDIILNILVENMIIKWSEDNEVIMGEYYSHFLTDNIKQLLREKGILEKNKLELAQEIKLIKYDDDRGGLYYFMDNVDKKIQLLKEYIKELQGEKE